MQSAPFAHTVFAHLPFSFAKDLQACGLRDDVHRPFGKPPGDGDPRAPAPVLGEQGVIGSTQGQAHQLKQRVDEAVHGPQAKMVLQAHHETCLQVEVDEGLVRAPPGGAGLLVEPDHYDVPVEPEGKRAALDQALVIRRPVDDLLLPVLFARARDRLASMARDLRKLSRGGGVQATTSQRYNHENTRV